jgi:hypothetical protein
VPRFYDSKATLSNYPSTRRTVITADDKKSRWSRAAPGSALIDCPQFQNISQPINLGQKPADRFQVESYHLA